MALYIPHNIFHLARLLYVRPETFGPYCVCQHSNVVTALELRKRKTTDAVQEAGCVPQSAWSLWRRKTTLYMAGNQLRPAPNHTRLITRNDNVLNMQRGA